MSTDRPDRWEGEAQARFIRVSGHCRYLSPSFFHTP